MLNFSSFPIQLALDALLVGVSWLLAFWLRFNFDIPDDFFRLALVTLPGALLAYAVGLRLAAGYRNVWRYTGLPDLRRMGLGILIGAVLVLVLTVIQRPANFPRSVLLLHPIVCLVLLGAARAGWRTLAEHQGGGEGGLAPLLIVGSLREASVALGAIKGSTQWLPIGIISPQERERGLSLQNVRVLGGVQELREVVLRTGAQAALVASPSGSAERRQILLQAPSAGISLLTLPRPEDWLDTRSGAPRKIELEDLLGRAPVRLDVAGLAEMVSGQTVMVTGAGGSIGSELCRQLAKLGAARLVCVDMSEFAIYSLEQELMQAHAQMRGIYYTANVREPDRLAVIASRHKPSVVFHAAAYKHVPLMEQLNEVEALRTNVLGTLNAARVAGACGARRFVMISTDKAVNPTNVMGASKRLAELVVQAVAAEYPATQYVSVRFGNVLGSSGSVVPLFTQQVARGGPVTVTHPEIVRYFMTIPEAAQLVLQAGQMGRSGQIFVLDMGEPVKIVELARMLIRLSGKTEEDVPITFTGLRPGEKLFEELLANDETTETTPHPKLRIAKAAAAAVADVEAVRLWIEAAGPAPAEDAVRDWLRSQVPEYQPR